ncbi:MAG: glycosyltransferase [Bacteroidales bacterium]|nr:glycosyltransferase [Bacteroidales bacterium]
MSRVDIIVPVYNVAPYLRRCLDSILSQTMPDWRAICVDDGSTDESASILDEYASEDERFVVVHTMNEGLSAARNIGMELSSSEYIMFIDSDDFIHPQTLEIGTFLADRDSSDIVTWYRDSNYRNREIRFAKYLGKDTVSLVPRRYSTRYDLNSIRTSVVDDFGRVCTDWRHPQMSVNIKHCFVWRHLFRRSSVVDLKFVPRQKYEDIVWWSELMLRPLKATITSLPLYYYYPNFGSITKASTRLDKTCEILRGLSIVYRSYRKSSSYEQMSRWSHNIKWAILFGSAKKLDEMTEGDTSELIHLLSDLRDMGFFEDATTVKEIWARSKFIHFITGEPRPLLGSMILKMRVYAAR